MNSMLQRGVWSIEEDQRLLEFVNLQRLVNLQGLVNLKELASPEELVYLEGLVNPEELVNPKAFANLKRLDNLKELVNLPSNLNWVHISALVGSRTPKQCRKLYHQNLKPGLSHVPLLARRRKMIEHMVSRIGRRWAKIAHTYCGGATMLLRAGGT